jgi:hypothetical protein
VQFKTKQSVEILYDCVLGYAQPNDLIKEKRNQIQSLLAIAVKHIRHAKLFTAFSTSICLKNVFYKPEFQTSMTKYNIMNVFCTHWTFDVVFTIAYGTVT